MGKIVFCSDGASDVPATEGTARSTAGFTWYVRNGVGLANLAVFQSASDALNIGLGTLADINIAPLTNFRVRSGAVTVRFHVDTTGLAFFGEAPVAQPADIGALTDSTGGVVDGTLAAVVGSGADATINNNFADLADRVNALRLMLQQLGLMA